MGMPSGNGADSGAVSSDGASGRHAPHQGARRARGGYGAAVNDATGQAVPPGWPAGGGIGSRLGGSIGAPGNGTAGAPGDGRVGAPGDERVGAPGTGATTGTAGGAVGR
ncbi:hypothetical protein [Ralstonia syzygii]|nr:hypothetical protein [Ralstonia syzygii]